MDKRVVEKKLESLRRCVVRLQSKTPETAIELHNNLDLQDIIALNLTRAVQVCVDIAAHLISDYNCDVPETMGGAFTSLLQANVISEPLAGTMRSAVGFRNIAVHNYEEINWDIVFAICTEHLGDFKGFAQEISKVLDK